MHIKVMYQKVITSYILEWRSNSVFFFKYNKDTNFFCMHTSYYPYNAYSNILLFSIEHILQKFFLDTPHFRILKNYGEQKPF